MLHGTKGLISKIEKDDLEFTSPIPHVQFILGKEHPPARSVYQGRCLIQRSYDWSAKLQCNNADSCSSSYSGILKGYDQCTLSLGTEQG